MFNNSSVLPTCAEDITTTSRVRRSLIASIGSAMNGARLVRHCPDSALVSELSRRVVSAHSTSERFGGGRNALLVNCHSDSSGFWEGFTAEFFEGIVQCLQQ